MTNEPHIKVGEVMNRDVHLIDPMATVRMAIQDMAKYRVSSLVIERRDESDELGLILVTDIARDVIAEGKSPDRINVYEVMSKPVQTLDEDMHIKYGIRLLNRFRLSRALVTDHQRNLVGIVTMRDMVLRYAKDDAGPR